MSEDQISERIIAAITSSDRGQNEDYWGLVTKNLLGSAAAVAIGIFKLPRKPSVVVALRNKMAEALRQGVEDILRTN